MTEKDKAKAEPTSRRKFMKYVGAGVVIVGAAAAGAYYVTLPRGTPATITTATTETTPAGKTRIDFFVWTWGIEMIQDNVNKFNAKHPDIDVRMTDVAQETYYEGALARMVGNVPTDVMYADVSQQVAFEAAGYIVPTEDYFPEIRKYEKDFTKGYWPGVVNKEGKMMGLQYYGDYTGLWYNPGHLQKAGIDEPPKTWEDLLDQCLKIKQKGIAEFPSGAFFGSYGFWQTLYAFLVGMSDPVVPPYGYLFDKDNNVIFLDEKGPFFQTLRWLVDAINKHKIFSPATINYGDPDIINTLAAETHTFGWAPRYDIPGVNVEGTKVWTDVKGVRQALNPGTKFTSCWLRPYNMTKTNVNRGKVAMEAQWKFQQYMGGKTDPNTFEPDIDHGVYVVCKRIAIEKGVGFVYEPLWQDPDVIAAYTKWNTGYDVMVEQTKYLHMHQADGGLVPYWPKWSGGFGVGPARAELQGLLLGQKGTTNQDIMNVLKTIADSWNELKTEG